MKFATTTVLSALLCAEAALGLVPAERQARREARRDARHIARREARARGSGLWKVETKEDATVQSNWGGAILEGSGFTAASATVSVPEGGGGASAAGSAWVGIDGATCQTAILQTGIDWYGDGTFDAWYEWYPEVSSDFSGIDISEGDSISMSVVATSLNSGSATLENLSTGQQVTEQFTDITAGSLCGSTVEFIIEDFEECSSSGDCEPVPFASFSPAVTFSDVSAVTNGNTVDLTGAEMTEVIVNNEDLTSCSASGSTLTCSYV